MKKQKILIIVVLLLAAFLRLYKLGSYPALNADEAAIGYNAYSLIETGRDEHGNPWPVNFQSFNDYKPGLYFYLVLPFVKLIGLNEWSVRLPSALLGVATVYLVYLLVRKLFKEGSSQIKERIGADKMALMAALMLAISPWHIHFSRGGWEVNVATFFITAGLLLFIKSMKNPKYFFLSALSFSLSLYTYHAARVVVPFVGLGVFVIYWKGIITNLKTIVIAGLICVVLLTPLIKEFTGGEIASRAAGVGLFADAGPLARIHEQRGEHNNLEGVFTIVMHNKLVNYGLAFAENWSEHFHGEFLFLSGDVIQRNKVPEIGQMYLLDMFFLLAGFAFIIINWGRNRSFDRGWLVILWWLIVAPIPAALTFQSPHALRAQNMVIPLVIISAYGFVSVLKWLGRTLSSNYLLTTIYFLLALGVVLCFTRYQHMYWVHMSKEYPFSSQYGVKELVNYLARDSNKYNNIVITNRYDQPYILFLFYSKYSPVKFQQDHWLTSRDNFGFSTVSEFDKYIFKKIDWESDKVVYPDSLIIGTDEEIPKESNVIESIYGKNGHLYFKIVAN